MKRLASSEHSSWQTSDAMNMKNRIVVALIGLALTLAGCAGDPVVTAQGSGLLYGQSVAPLPQVAVDTLGMAPDCAGRIGNVSATNLRFEVASLNAGLVAVLDGSGGIICVDSVSDVQSDLDSSGQSAEADAVVAGFFAAVQQADGHPSASRFRGGVYGGDPEPQPNTQPGRLPDPEPQPN